MPRPRISIHIQHQADDFWLIYRATTCAVERRRAQFFALLAERRSLHEVLSITKYSVPAAHLVIKRYHEHGLAGLQDGRRQNQGAPRVLSAEEQQRLATRLHEDFKQGIVWDGKQVQAWVEHEFGKQVYLGRTYEFMRAAGLSPQTPRPQHVQSDPVAQEAFKTKS